jgi:hypothetical protein
MAHNDHPRDTTKEGAYMHAKGMTLWSLLVAALVLTPLLAAAQVSYRESRQVRTYDQARGPIQVINDWRDVVNVSMWSEHRERIGEWTVQPGERAMLGEARRPIRVRPNYKIKVGDDWGWVDVGQVGQFQNGTWYVNVREVWQATHERPRPSDSRRGEVYPRDRFVR